MGPFQNASPQPKLLCLWGTPHTKSQELRPGHHAQCGRPCFWIHLLRGRAHSFVSSSTEGPVHECMKLWVVRLYAHIVPTRLGLLLYTCMHCQCSFSGLKFEKVVSMLLCSLHASMPFLEAVHPDLRNAPSTHEVKASIQMRPHSTKSPEP